MTTAADHSLFDQIATATCLALRRAETDLPQDIQDALERARAHESNPVAREELGNILKNCEIARSGKIPICQDTGVPVIYLTVPPSVPVTEDLLQAVAEGVRTATARIPLRPNVVDPCTRQNSGDNTGEGMPAVHLRPGRNLELTVLPKGAGSENVSRIGMLLPSRPEDIRRFVVETMLHAGGRPCPPVVLGVGIGGTFDGAAALAKEALLLPIDRMSGFEQDLCNAVNDLGIGPMGLGGDVTALAVRVKFGGCHTASLPVAVNIQCWACRRAAEVVEVGR